MLRRRCRACPGSRTLAANAWAGGQAEHANMHKLTSTSNTVTGLLSYYRYTMSCTDGRIHLDLQDINTDTALSVKRELPAAPLPTQTSSLEPISKLTGV